MSREERLLSFSMVVIVLLGIFCFIEWEYGTWHQRRAIVFDRLLGSIELSLVKGKTDWLSVRKACERCDDRDLPSRLTDRFGPKALAQVVYQNRPTNPSVLVLWFPTRQAFRVSADDRKEVDFTQATESARDDSPRVFVEQLH